MSDWLKYANQASEHLSTALTNVHDTAFICKEMAKDLFPNNDVTPEIVLRLTEIAFMEAKRVKELSIIEEANLIEED